MATIDWTSEPKKKYVFQQNRRLQLSGKKLEKMSTDSARFSSDTIKVFGFG